MKRPQAADGRIAANMLNKQSRTTDKEWSSSLEFEGGATTTQLNNLVTKMSKNDLGLRLNFGLTT
jgi:hypothetical protein